MSYDEQVKIFCHSCLQKLDVTTFPPFSRLACPICHCELVVPEKFGKYLLEEKLSCNDVFSVYRACDTEKNVPVALTVFSGTVTSTTDVAEKIEDAINRASAVNGAVEVFETGTEKNRFFFASKYMAGGSLEDRLRDAHGEPVAPKQAARWILDAAKVLAKAKKSGITHGDVKPENVFFDGDGHAYLGNFGITDAILEALSDKDQTFIPETTPCYMSPEKLMRSGDGGEEDMFSLGAVFYRLVTGKQAFSGCSTEELIHARLDDAVSAPSSVRPEIPENVSSLIMAMMSFDKDGRPSCEAVIGALETFLAEAKEVRASGSNRRKNVMQKTIDDGDCRIVHQRSSYLSGCLLTAIVILLALLVFFLWKRPNTQKEETPVKTEEVVFEETSGNTAEEKISFEQNVPATNGQKAETPYKDVVRNEKNELSSVQKATPVTSDVKTDVSADNSTEKQNITTYVEKDDAPASQAQKNASSAANGKSSVLPESDKEAENIDKLLDWMGKAATKSNDGNPGGLKDWQAEIMAKDEEDVAGKKLSPANVGENEKKYRLKGRPMPAAPAKIKPDDMKDYLLSLPEEMRKPELRRAIYVNATYEYVVAVSKRGAYPTKGFTTTNGKKVSKGSIVFAPDHLLVIHGGSGKGTQVKPDELPYHELVGIMKYYVYDREKLTLEEDKTPNPIETPEDRKERMNELGRAFLRLSLIYDWYGRSNEAAATAEKALKYAPGLKKTTENLLLK